MNLVRPFTNTTLQDAAGAVGNGDALSLEGAGGVLVFIKGTFVGTVTFEVTQDGVNWVAIPGYKLTDGTQSSAPTVGGMYLIICPGVMRFRARVSAYTSGAITVTATSVEASSVAAGFAAVAALLSTLVTQTAPTKMGTLGTGTAAASAAAIGSSQACLSVLLINTHATLSLKWGDSLAQPATLEAGGQQVIPASNVAQVFAINGSGSATFAYIPEVAV